MNIKGNSFNSEMPFPQSETHILLLLKIKGSIIYVYIISVYRNSHDFMRAVEGAMKLLRACFSSFPCIFCLAKHNDRDFSWNFNTELRYVSSMLWNISEISEIFWKVLWAGQTSGIPGGYFGSGCAICGYTLWWLFTVLSIVSSKLCTTNLIIPWHYIYAANCTNKKLILDLSSSFFWYSWSFHLLENIKIVVQVLYKLLTSKLITGSTINSEISL